MNKKIPYYKILTCLIFSFLIAEKTSGEIQNEINSNNTKLKNLEQTIIRLESEINSIKSSEKNLSVHIEKINKKIEYREEQISILNAQDKSITKLIKKSEKEISEKEIKLSELKLKLEKRAIYLYKYGKNELVSKIMLEDDWNSALNKLKYLKILLEYEKKLNNNIEVSIDELEEEKEKLLSDKKSQRKILEESKYIYKELTKDKKNKLKKIEKIKNEKDNLTKDMLSKKKEVTEIQKLINQQISDVKAARKREEELARKRSIQNKATTGNFAKMKGKLSWPTDGTVIGKFGMQTNTTLHTVTENIGIDIKTSTAKPVNTILDGIVTKISWLPGYGKVILVDHGGEYYTVYSNIDNINVNEDDYILANTQIATTSKSENKSLTNSYILHFEILKKTERLNPEIWLVKK